MKLKQPLIAIFLCAGLSSPVLADYCDDTLGSVVGGAIEGGLIGTAAGAIADGREGANRGAAIGAAVGAIDGLVEGEIRRERCRRDMEDLEAAVIEDELDDMYLEEVVIDDAIYGD